MSIKRNIKKSAIRAVGRRFNPFGPDDETAVTELQDTLEKIAEKVDSKSGTVEKSDSAGLEGSLRAVKSKNDWYLEMKTEEGWIRSSVGSFTLKDKNS